MNPNPGCFPCFSAVKCPTPTVLRRSCYNGNHQGTALTCSWGGGGGGHVWRWMGRGSLISLCKYSCCGWFEATMSLNSEAEGDDHHEHTGDSPGWKELSIHLVHFWSPHNATHTDGNKQTPGHKRSAWFAGFSFSLVFSPGLGGGLGDKPVTPAVYLSSISTRALVVAWGTVLGIMRAGVASGLRVSCFIVL